MCVCRRNEDISRSVSLHHPLKITCAQSIGLKSDESNWKWQASDGEDNSYITSTWSCQWSEATRRCLYHEGQINPSFYSIEIRESEGNSRCSFTRMPRFTSFQHTHLKNSITFSPTKRNERARNSIVRNDIIRPGLSICTISSQVNLSESSGAHVSSSKIRTSSTFSSPAAHNESIKVVRSDSFISTICSSSNEISTYSLKTLRGIPDGIVCSPRLLQSTLGPWQEQTDGHASAIDGCWNNRRI